MLFQRLPQRGLEEAQKDASRAVWGVGLEGVANEPFSSTKTVVCKPPPKVDLGAFIRAQIIEQQDSPNPISFDLPVGRKGNGKVWLASKKNRDGTYSKIIGDGRHWRVNFGDVLKIDRWCPVTFNEPAVTRPLSGFQVRLCIEAEKELPLNEQLDD